MLGKIVKVIVDRPLGTYHPTHKDICYSVNYGYVDDVIAGDGEEQDAYVLGVNKPIKEFVGKVIAIIHRFDDVEEKWVVASDTESFSKDEIMRQRILYRRRSYSRRSRYDRQLFVYPSPS